MSIDFQPFPKIARLNRTITITEKLDGTNAAVVIVPIANLDWEHIQSYDQTIDETLITEPYLIAQVGDFGVFAQSRTRFVTPFADNYGFAGWVHRNAEALVNTLGEGTHFGEWWGAGIQRRYGLTGDDKRFSLFNTSRWVLPEGDDGAHLDANLPGLAVVPVLYEGPFNQVAIFEALITLQTKGSQAARRFFKPEGIVIFHHASRDLFKITLEGDEAPKGFAAHLSDVGAV